MARKGYEKISQREYARRLGISNEAVSKAVREARIKKGWNKKENKIIVQHADKEFGVLFKNENLIPETTDPVENGSEVSSNGDIRKGSDKLTLTAKSSYSEARRVQAILQAELTGKELAKITGELVNKEAVYKQLFTYGQNLRTQLLAIPDRTIDNIMSSKTRTEAHTLLTNALYEALESLTNTDQLNFEQE